jgi:nucleoid-associated protein YgaU
MAKDKPKKKSLIDKAIDAVTDRDERAAEEAAKKKAAAAAAAKKMAEEGQRRAAELKKSDERARAAEKAAAEAQAKLEQLEREKKSAEVAEKIRQQVKERAEAKKKTYVVKSGDSLSKIAKEVYGDAKRWPEIFEANKDKIKDPNLIYPDQELTIP